MNTSRKLAPLIHRSAEVSAPPDLCNSQRDTAHQVLPEGNLPSEMSNQLSEARVHELSVSLYCRAVPALSPHRLRHLGHAPADFLVATPALLTCSACLSSAPTRPAHFFSLASLQRLRRPSSVGARPVRPTGPWPRTVRDDEADRRGNALAVAHRT